MNTRLFQIMNHGRAPSLLLRQRNLSFISNGQTTFRTTKTTAILTPARRTMTTNNTSTQNFSTNPYSESIKKLKSQGKLAVKVAGYTLLSVTAATALIWQSYHWYIEYFLSRSPASLNYKAKLLLHGAYFREHVAPDYGMAAFYLDQVLQVALEEQQLDEQDPDMIQLRLRLAFDEWHAGHLFDAITQYTRAWTSLVSTTSSSPSAKHHDDMITTAKHLGDLYTRVGDSEKAEEYLTWAFYAVTKPESNNVDISNGNRLRKINIICSLASLYAMQRQFHLALPLFLQALQSIPDGDDSKNGGDGDEQWLCVKAILQNQLSETLYGMGKPKESMGWAQAALSSSSDGMAKYNNAKDCRECGGVVSNNLGKLLEIKGEFDQALVYYKQAQMYASTMDDTSSQVQYDDNVIRLEKLTHKDEENATLAQDLLASKKEDVSNNQSKEQQQGWPSWFGGRGDNKKDTK